MRGDGGGRRWAWKGAERRLLFRVVIVVVLTFMTGYMVSSVWMWAGASSRSVVTVPDLRERDLDDARREVERYELVLAVADSLPNPEVAAGQVLTQSPLPGQEVAPGIAVRVILSSGPERHAIPQVSSLSREQAEQLLTATGLQPVVEEVTDSRRAGRVIGTVPTAGTVVAIPARVRLLISSGPPLVGVPMVVGVQEMELLSTLGATGLRLGEVTRELRLLEPEGQVIAQSPQAGDSIPAGSPVNVIVATQRPELLVPMDIQ